jgi:hypothetical protein
MGCQRTSHCSGHVLGPSLTLGPCGRAAEFQRSASQNIMSSLNGVQGKQLLFIIFANLLSIPLFGQIRILKTYSPWHIPSWPITYDTFVMLAVGSIVAFIGICVWWRNRYYAMIYQVFVCLISFLCTFFGRGILYGHWQIYDHKFSVPSLFDITEASLPIILVLFISAAFGGLLSFTIIKFIRKRP